MRRAVVAGCDRLVHPSVARETERAGQARLIALLIGAPFASAAAAFALLPASAGLTITLAFVCAGLGAAWMGVLVVASSACGGVVARAALLAATAQCTALIAAAGGLVSPVSAVALALPIEAWLLCRDRRALAWGGIAAVLALALGQWIAETQGMAAPVAAWHWAVPTLYALTVLARVDRLVPAETQAPDRIVPLEEAIDGVVIRMTADGEILEASAASRRLLRLAPEMLGGNGLFERIHIGDRVAYLSALADLREGVPRRHAEIRLRLAQNEDGSEAETFGDFAIELTRDAAKTAIVTGIIRDNSEMAALRRSLTTVREESDRLDVAKGRFLATVSHELRTPLNSIIGFSDMLLHEMFGPFGDPRQREYVELVRDSGNHLLAVVNSILDISKIEAGTYAMHTEHFAFRDAVEKCNAMMSVQAGDKQVELSAEIAPEVGDVNADPRAVQQILINLVSNAVKFTPKGGAVSIGARCKGAFLQFWVSDTGIGIAAADLEKLGRPFTQVQNDYTRHFEGAGLGLSLVRGLVSLHEGGMTIESAPGQGTTVTIMLPLEGPRSGGERTAQPISINRARDREAADGALRKAS